jgi:DNA-binding CsgD family transcriptional regulator
MTDQPPDAIVLTAREREVLAMVAQGLTNREVGAALFISESTAGVHVSNIMAKLGAASRTEAATIAIRSGLVPGMAPPPSEPQPAPAEPAEPDFTAADHPPEPTGWWGRIKVQAARHPRTTTAALAIVVILGAVTAGLGFAVLTADPPAGVAGASPTPAASVSGADESPTATPAPSASGSASGSASPSAAASAGASGASTPSPVAAITPPPDLQPAGTWEAAASMVDPRWDASATLVDDGSVIVMGGLDTDTGIGCLRSVERYDPASNRWKDEAFMPDGRCSHSATLLDDGRILVAGGYFERPEDYRDPLPVTAAASIYDPETDGWTEVDPMSTARRNHRATLLDNGRVLVVGGLTTEGDPIATAEIFNPAQGGWSSTGSMSDPRPGMVFAELADGRVLVAGGQGGQRGTTALATAEVYDPASGTWDPVDDMRDARADASAMLLGNGKVLVFGGIIGNGLEEDDVTASAELFDASTEEWSATGSRSVASYHALAARLDNGDVLAVGGATLVGTSSELAPVERYDVSGGRWVFDGNPGQPRTGAFLVGLDDGTVLLGGGSRPSPDDFILASAERYEVQEP